MAGRSGPRGYRSALSFAPGHVTGIFAPDRVGRDPRARGSVGAGIVIDLGVEATVRWWPEEDDGLSISGNGGSKLPITRDVVGRIARGRRGKFEVHLRHDLPIGQGFGMSAAGALATALATARLVGVGRQPAIEIAHLAELFGGGGLGGVAAILGGGFEVREKPGVPPFGRVRHQPFRYPVFLVVAGRPVPSPGVLVDSGFLRRVSLSARGGLERIRRDPSPGAFLEESETFTDKLALGSNRLARTIHDLRSEGARVCQAMIGGSLFAVPTSAGARSRLVRALVKKRLGAIEVRASDHGAVTSSRKERRSLEKAL